MEAVRKTKLYLKTQAELAEEEAARQKKKKEKELAELLNTKNQTIEETYIISAFWRDYIRAFEQLER